MKHLLSLSFLVTGLLLLAPGMQAQDRGDSSISPLRGTYTYTGSAWQDMSVINPELPKGYAPVSLIGAFAVNGDGDVTGWGLVNAGGIPFKAEFVNSHVSSPRADGSFTISLSMRINEFGGIIDGPYTYVGVIAGNGSALEIDFMMLGTGPGSHLELSHAKRISMKFD
jgi:hypothetical protein